MRMIKKALAALRRSRWRYDHLVHITLSKKNLLANLAYYQRLHPTISLAPVLKSNAYGHGLIPVAQILQESSTPFFVVDSYYEALILRNEGVTMPLLVIGFTSDENIHDCVLPAVAFTLSNYSQLENLSRTLGRTRTFHLKIDTGMHRQGLMPSEFESCVALVKKNPHIVVEGICSHFADAENDISPLTEKQIVLWNECAARARAAFPDLKWRHISATAGHRLEKDCDVNAIRLGLGLYGYSLVAADQDYLSPVLEMMTRITAIRELAAGESVGYNGTYHATTKRRIATLPVGYAEGLDRGLSNCGAVMVNEKICPIVGRVSMNMTTIDVTDVSDVVLGMSVTVISRRARDANALGNMARLCNTIVYVLLVHIPAVLRRSIVEG